MSPNRDSFGFIPSFPTKHQSVGGPFLQLPWLLEGAQGGSTQVGSKQGHQDPDGATTDASDASLPICLLIAALRRYRLSGVSFPPVVVSSDQSDLLRSWSTT